MKNKNLINAERMIIEDAEIFKSGEILMGTVFEVNQNNRYLVVDLERGGRFNVDVADLTRHFQKGERVELILDNGAVYSRKLRLSFAYFKKRFPVSLYRFLGEEKRAKVLILGTKAIYLYFDDDCKVMGCYKTAYGILPERLSGLKAGDEVCCLCGDQNGKYVNILDIVQI